MSINFITESEEKLIDEIISNVSKLNNYIEQNKEQEISDITNELTTLNTKFKQIFGINFLGKYDKSLIMTQFIALSTVESEQYIDELLNEYKKDKTSSNFKQIYKKFYDKYIIKP